MNFNLNDAPEPNVNTNINIKQYQKPGIFDDVRVTEVVLGASSLNKVPYLEIRTVGANGEIGKSNRMWLSNTIGKNLDGTPKKTSGWGVTQRNLLDLIMATHNISREEAKPKLDVSDENKEKAYQKLVDTVSRLLVGKPFRGKFKGEQGKPREDGSAGAIFATLDLVESMNVPKESSSLRFDVTRDVKAHISHAVSADNSDLPF